MHSVTYVTKLRKFHFQQRIAEGGVPAPLQRDRFIFTIFNDMHFCGITYAYSTGSMRITQDTRSVIKFFSCYYH